MFPRALMAQARVTSVPVSADVDDPTCLSPRLATMCSGFYTLVTVSSKFQMSFASNLYLFSTLLRLSKKWDTLWRLKLIALDKLIGCGHRIDRQGCLFLKAMAGHWVLLPCFRILAVIMLCQLEGKSTNLKYRKKPKHLFPLNTAILLWYCFNTFLYTYSLLFVFVFIPYLFGA